MPDNEAPDTRKTVTFTHKQLGISGGVIAALTLVSQLKGSFVTREEGTAQSKEIVELRVAQDRQFDDVKKLIGGVQEELSHKLERLNDKQTERVKDVEARAVHTSDTQDRRIDTLEAAILQSTKSKKN